MPDTPYYVLPTLAQAKSALLRLEIPAQGTLPRATSCPKASLARRAILACTSCPSTSAVGSAAVKGGAGERGKVEGEEGGGEVKTQGQEKYGRSAKAKANGRSIMVWLGGRNRGEAKGVNKNIEGGKEERGTLLYVRAQRKKT